MLVIRRKPGETIVIGNQVRVTVLESRGGTVKLGIEAPRELSVHRQELLESIERANRAASQSGPPDPAVVAGLPRPPREDE